MSDFELESNMLSIVLVYFFNFFFPDVFLTRLGALFMFEVWLFQGAGALLEILDQTTFLIYPALGPNHLDFPSNSTQSNQICTVYYKVQSSAVSLFSHTAIFRRKGQGHGDMAQLTSSAVLSFSANKNLKKFISKLGKVLFLTFEDLFA